MSKSIWVFSCHNESGDSWVCGYFNRELTEAEQHAYFKKNHASEYANTECGEDAPTNLIHWELLKLERLKILPPLPKHLWSESL